MLVQIPDFPAHLSERELGVMKAVLETMTFCMYFIRMI